MVGAAYAYGKRKQLPLIYFEKSQSVHAENRGYRRAVLVIVFCIVVMVMGGLRLCATAADQSSAALGIPMPYIYMLPAGGCGTLYLLCLIFIGEDVKELRDNRGQFTAEHPIAEQKNSLHLADTPKNENGRNDIS